MPSIQPPASAPAHAHRSADAFCAFKARGIAERLRRDAEGGVIDFSVR